MGAFGTVASAYSTLAETLNTIGNGVRMCAADGKGDTVDAWNESLGLAAAEVSKLADTAMSTSAVCEAQDSTDSAMDGADPTPQVVQEARDRYAASPTPENRQTLAELMQQRADALDAHTAATEGTVFPEVPGSGGGDGDGAGTGDEDGGRGEGGGHAGDDGEGDPNGDNAPEPSTHQPPQPAGTSPSSPPSTPHTTVSDPDAGTSLSGDNAAVPQTSALSSTPAAQQGGAAPGQGGGIGQAFTAPTTGSQLSSTPNTSQTRKQRQEQEQDEKVASNAENAAAMASMLLPDAMANAQSYTVPGTPHGTSLSGSTDRFGQPPAGMTSGQTPPPHGGPIGPGQTAAMGSGAHPMRYRPPPPPPPPHDAEKERREDERRAAEKRMGDAWK